MARVPSTVTQRLVGLWARWRARPSSPFDTTLAELWITVTPIWAVLVAGLVVHYGLLRPLYPDSIPPVSADAVLGVLLLPLMVFGCFVILKTWRRAGLISAALVAIATAFIFGALARPTYGLATLINPLANVSVTWADHLLPQDPRSWAQWKSNIVQFVVLYLSCAAAAVGFLSYRSLMNERLLRTRVEARAAHERLRALRAQLNPHFLYNTLNSIVTLSEEHSESVESLIGHLSDLLRRTLTASECEEHALSDELAYIEAYLNVQHIRYPSRVSWTTDVAPGCTPLRVPSLVMQPLIENAVMHGLRSTAAHLDIRIEIKRFGQQLQLAVSNNCLAPGPQAVPARNGFGLRHVRERLAVLFGDRAALETERLRPDRFHALLRLPIGGVNPEIW